MPDRGNALGLSGANLRLLESLYSRDQLAEGMVELLRASEEPALRLGSDQRLAPTRSLFAAESSAGERRVAPEWIQLIRAGGRRGAAREDSGLAPGLPRARPARGVPALQRAARGDPSQGHRSQSHRAPQLGPPAAGWLDELTVRNEVEIWGHVEWTDDGREDVEQRRYGYISPVVSLLHPINSETGARDHSKVPELYEVQDASLVNSPGLYIRWLLSDPESEGAESQQHAVEQPPRAAKDTPMSNSALDQFLQHFGLSADAGSSVTGRVLETFGLSVDSTQGAFEAALARVKGQPPIRVEDTAEFREMKAKVDRLETEQRRANETATHARVQELCSKAQREGRIMPAHFDSWVSHGMREGPDKLAAEFEQLPRLSLTRPAELLPVPTSEELGQLDEGDKAAAGLFGLAPEEFSQAKARQLGLRVAEHKWAATRAALGDPV